MSIQKNPVDVEKLQKKLSQKRTEAELWKQKYEHQINQMMQTKQNYEKEIWQFQKETRNLLDRIDELKKQPEQSSLIRRNQLDLSDSTTRKMKEMVDAKNEEIMKLNSLRNDDDMEIKRLLDDNQQLRSALSKIDQEKQTEIDDLYMKLSNSEYHQAHRIDRQYTEMGHLEREIEQLHKLLDLKNDEIENILNENISQKEFYENEHQKAQNMFERQICDLRFKSRDDLTCLEQQLVEMQRKEIARLSFKYDNQLAEIEKDNRKFRELNDYHIQQCKQLENQISQLKQEIELKSIKFLECESLKNRCQIEYDEKLRKLQIVLNEERQKCESRDDQIENLDFNMQEQQSTINILEEEKNRLEDIIDSQKIELEQIKLKIYELELSKNKQIDNLTRQIDTVESGNREKVKQEIIYFVYLKVRQLNAQIESYDLEAKRFKEILEGKSNEIDNLLIQLNMLERENRKCRDEIEGLRAELLHQERLNAQRMEDLKLTLEANTINQIDHLNKTLAQQINNLTQENRELRLQNDIKNRDMQELNQRYTDTVRKNIIVKNDIDVSTVKKSFQLRE